MLNIFTIIIIIIIIIIKYNILNMNYFSQVLNKTQIGTVLIFFL